MRSAIIIALFLAAAPARGQEMRDHAPLARIVVEWLAPVAHRDWGYHWDAVSIRISRHMHWHLPPPDSRDRAEDAQVHRSGWANSGGQSIGVIAIGDDEGVASLQFSIGRQRTAEALIETLRAEGVVIEEESRGPDSGAAVIRPPGRDAGVLAWSTRCTPPQSRVQLCSASMTLTAIR